jgi:transposase InsO family protein
MGLKARRFLTQNGPEGRVVGGCWGVIISMENAEKLSREQIERLLEASLDLRFEGKDRGEMYRWITRTLAQQRYREQGKPMRGLLLRYLEKLTGRSRTQVTRLVGQYMKHSEVKPAVYQRHRFASRFTRADLELLARVDEAHETMSGPATKRILNREYEQYKHAEYERLASISVAHIYNLRSRRHYRECFMSYTKTSPVKVAIGERRRPQPNGKPGYLRVDTVHQGDLDGSKGVYHINAVDEVTQWQVIGSVSAITQSHLKPVLQAILAQFPFAVRSFHSDNGSEFINGTVEGLLKDLLIEQTKSRPRKSNDNGLVESKNGAVIRKHMGYGFIAQLHAPSIHEFYRNSFNSYLNFHRPCGLPELIISAGGKNKYIYRRYATPWEVLRELTSAQPAGQSYLTAGVSVQALDQLALAQSDTECARHMQEAKRLLFLSFQPKCKTA